MKLFKDFITKKAYSNIKQATNLANFKFTEKQQVKEPKQAKPKIQTQDNTNTQSAAKKEKKVVIPDTTFKNDDKKEGSFKPKSDDDIKYEYEDKKFFLNYQWNKIKEDKKRMYQNFECPEMTNHQKHECDVIIKIMKSFNFCEFLVFQNELRRFTRMDVSNKVPKPFPTLSEIDSNFEATQKILYSLKPFVASGYFSGGKAAEVVQEKVEEAVKVEKVEEKVVVKEKAVVNIILVGFDAAKKLNLIKEFRTLYNLGLKEAKEAVEKNPNVIQPNVKREEALKVKAKLEELGAKIELD